MEGGPPSNPFPFFLFEEGLYTKEFAVAGIAHCVSGDPKAESPLLQFTQDLLQGTGGGSESLYHCMVRLRLTGVQFWWNLLWL